MVTEAAAAVYTGVRPGSQGRLHQSQGAPQGENANVPNQETRHGYNQVTLKNPLYGFH